MLAVQNKKCTVKRLWSTISRLQLVIRGQSTTGGLNTRRKDLFLLLLSLLIFNSINLLDQKFICLILFCLETQLNAFKTRQNEMCFRMATHYSPTFLILNLEYVGDKTFVGRLKNCTWLHTILKIASALRAHFQFVFGRNIKSVVKLSNIPVLADSLRHPLAR